MSYFFFFFNRRYNPWWVLACFTISFHTLLSLHFSLQFLTFIFFKSPSTCSSHLSFYDTLRTGIVQSVYDLATACTIRVSNPDRGSRYLSSAKQEIQNSSGTCQAPCRPAYPVSARSSGIKWQRHDDDHSPPTNVEVKNHWSYTSTPPI